MNKIGAASCQILLPKCIIQFPPQAPLQGKLTERSPDPSCIRGRERKEEKGRDGKGDTMVRERRGLTGVV